MAEIQGQTGRDSFGDIVVSRLVFYFLAATTVVAVALSWYIRLAPRLNEDHPLFFAPFLLVPITLALCVVLPISTALDWPRSARTERTLGLALSLAALATGWMWLF